MTSYILKEETIHYIAAFLERWGDKAPNASHKAAEKDIRNLSNMLIENLYYPLQVNVVRKPKDK